MPYSRSDTGLLSESLTRNLSCLVLVALNVLLYPELVFRSSIWLPITNVFALLLMQENEYDLLGPSCTLVKDFGS
jgi:hypothetical protein